MGASLLSTHRQLQMMPPPSQRTLPLLLAMYRLNTIETTTPPCCRQVLRVWAPGLNALLIHLLISALCTFFACVLNFPTYFFFSLLIFLTHLLPYLPFSLRIGPLCFQAGGVRGDKTWTFKLFQFILSCVRASIDDMQRYGRSD